MVVLRDINTVDALIDRVFSYNPEANADLLRRAYAFSNEMHYKQKRKAGSPYIEHPLAVAAILCGMRMDTNTISAGLLHDTVEDTDTTSDDIKGLFGEDVASLVESLTKLNQMEFRTICALLDIFQKLKGKR
jgi:GTP pyrophosphokinase